MTDPYARPQQPGPNDYAWSTPQDETIPLVPGSGYASQPATPLPGGPEPTSIDPLSQDRDSSGDVSYSPAPGYSNPSFATPTPQPVPQPAPPRTSLPPVAQPYQFEQPPAGSPYGNPAPQGYSPYGASTGFQTGQVVPAYPTAYPAAYPAQQLPEHPLAVPALVLSIVGFFTGITFPIAWYLGVKGGREVRQQPGRYNDGPLLTIAKWIGAIGTIGLALIIGLMMLIFVLAFAAAVA